MGTIRSFGVLAMIGIGMLIFGSEARAQQSVAERMNAHLAQASVSQGISIFSDQLSASPGDDEIRFALGFLQFVDAIQNVGQSLYRYGLRPESEFVDMIPVLRLPVPMNPTPEPVTNRQVRQVLERLIHDLMEVESTLSQIQSETVQLGVQLGIAYLDFDADGIGTEEESLWKIYARLNRRSQGPLTPEQAEAFVINFDAGDAYWLRGYCHFISAFLEFYLAHDDSRLFEHTAHLFFVNPQTSYRFLFDQIGGIVSRYQLDQFEIDGNAVFEKLIANGWAVKISATKVRLKEDWEKEKSQMSEVFGEDYSRILSILQRSQRRSVLNFNSVMDHIAFIHLIDLPVIDAKRSEAALEHLEQVIRLSRVTWALYEKETDDDHEWIPNPRQTGVFGVTITQEMVQQWLAFLDEAELILSGKRLVPFWRGATPVGVNLRRVFTEPNRFDLVLWLQGTAATPYFEEGELTGADFWGRLMNSFNGQFVGFALWFN